MSRRRMEPVLTWDCREAKVFATRSGARRAARAAAFRLGLAPGLGGAGFMGRGKWTAYVHGKGWLKLWQ